MSDSQLKIFRILLLTIPNIIVAVIRYSSNLIFALGAACGAITFVYIFYVILLYLLEKKRLKYKRWISIIGAYILYYVLYFLT